MAFPIVRGGVKPKPNARMGKGRHPQMNVDVYGVDPVLLPSPGEKVKQCVFCRERSPSIFPNEQSRKEYQECSGICPCCWEVHTLDPNVSADVRKASNDILAFYGRRLILGRRYGQNKWQCLRCMVVVKGEDLEKPHVCEGQKYFAGFFHDVSLDKHKMHFGIDISPECDGSLIKVINRKGFNDSQPQIGDFVHIHYVGTLKNGVKFDSSRERGEEFRFVLGQGVLAGWDVGIATMKKGELCDLICASDFSKASTTSLLKIPPNETLTFEVELLSWEDAEDISPRRDKSITRRVLLEGDDKYGKPNEDALIEAHIKGVCAGRTFVDVDFKFSLGECTEHGLPGGVDEALTLLRKGETSFVALQPFWGYGNAGNAKFGIPPEAVLGFEIQLNDFAKAKEAWEMNDDEKLYASEVIKAHGNEYYESGKYKLAIGKYKKVVDLLKSEPAWIDDKKAKRDQLYTAARLNLAACYLKLGNTDACIDYSNSVLCDDSDNFKALFRRGMAYKQQKHFENAIMDFSRVLELDKNNTTTVDALKQCQKMMTEPIKVEKTDEKAPDLKGHYTVIRYNTEKYWDEQKSRRTVFGLKQCVYDNLLPSDQAVLHEWGFKNCRSRQEEVNLLGLYIGLIKILRVNLTDLEAWWKSGTLMENIKSTFEENLPPGGRGGYYPWLLQNQHILKNLTYGG